jgi:hypothetical protein
VADPLTLITLASGAISAVGAISAGNAASASSYYNAELSERDAYVSEQNIKTNNALTRIDVDAKRRDDKRMLSSIRASYGASGLSLAGSPLDVLADTSMDMAFDQRQMTYEGEVRGREGALQTLGAQESAVLNKAEGSSAKTAGYINAAGAAVGAYGTNLSRKPTRTG